MTPKLIKAQVEAPVFLTESIVRLFLVPDEFINYVAGQYLQILLNEDVLSFSIANAPSGFKHYELHIRHSNEYTQKFLDQILKEDFVDLKLPFGVCSIDHLLPNNPIIFIALGTGFAPIKAMIEHLISQKDPQPFELYWGARSSADLYMKEQVLKWKQNPNFKFCSFFIEEKRETLISSILERHAQDLYQKQIVISGPFDRVYKIRDALIAEGIPSSHLFSDAFSFEAS